MPSTRRAFIAGAAAAALTARAQSTMKTIRTPILEIGYEESGPEQGFPVILLHGFPDDAHAFDDVAPPLAKAGYRVLVPYIRGYGPTRFLDSAAPRMGEQAAIGQDLIDFADALKIPRFAVSGFDWGNRSANIAAALHPERVRAGVFIHGYSIQNVTARQGATNPEAAHTLWYQWFFQTENGRATLQANRKPLCKLLWQLWSPDWHFTDETYNRTAASFDNPDFVDIVIHSYRHRLGNAEGEERFKQIEQQLAQRPKIQCPAITMYGANDGVARPAAQAPGEVNSFPNLIARRVIPGCGHFLPRENPEAVSSALLEVLDKSK